MGWKEKTNKQKDSLAIPQSTIKGGQTAVLNQHLAGPLLCYECSDGPCNFQERVWKNKIKTHRFLVDGEREAFSRRQGYHVDVPFRAEQLERTLAARNGGHDVVRLKNGAPCSLQYQEQVRLQAVWYVLHTKQIMKKTWVTNFLSSRSVLTTAVV